MTREYRSIKDVGHALDGVRQLLYWLGGACLAVLSAAIGFVVYVEQRLDALDKAAVVPAAAPSVLQQGDPSFQFENEICRVAITDRSMTEDELEIVRQACDLALVVPHTEPDRLSEQPEDPDRLREDPGVPLDDQVAMMELGGLVRSEVVGAWRVTSEGVECALFLSLGDGLSAAQPAASRECGAVLDTVAGWTLSQHGQSLLLLDAANEPVLEMVAHHGGGLFGTLAQGQEVRITR